MKLDVTKDVQPDEYIKSEIEKYYKDLDLEYQVVNCELETEIDTAFSSVRTEENPFGNFLCDLMRFHHNADCAIVNSGNIRADRVFQKGQMKLVDWDDLIPFVVPILMIQCTGKVLKQACEVSVSKWPALEGRFMQTSNLLFSFDPSKEPGQRVDINDVYIGSKKIEADKLYKVATSDYMANGKDGYDCLLDATTLVDLENSLTLKDIVLSFFGKPNFLTLDLARNPAFVKEKELFDQQEAEFAEEQRKHKIQNKFKSALKKVKALSKFTEMYSSQKVAGTQTKGQRTCQLINADNIA